MAEQSTTRRFCNKQGGEACCSFISFPPLSLSLPVRNNWRGVPSRGKQLIEILPQTHERPLGGPSTGARRKAAPPTPPAFPEKPPATDHQLSPGRKTKGTSSHSSASPVHSGEDPSRLRVLELPCRSSPTFFCSSLLLLPPRWIQSEEPAGSAGPEVLYL